QAEAGRWDGVGGRRRLVAWIGVGLLPITPLGLAVFPNRAHPEYERPARAFVRPSGDHWLQPMPRPRTTSFVTASALVVTVPLDDNRCFSAPLPCTPHPAANVRLRVPGQLGSGFVTDGPWEQAYWPNRYSSFLAAWRRDGARWSTWSYVPPR